MQQKSLFATAVFCGAFLCALSAFAEELTFSPTYSQCMDAAGGETFSMIDCMQAETEAWDKKLNGAYKRAMKDLSPQRQTALKGVQRLWIQYRDAKCAFAYDPDGGQMAQISANSCSLEMTAARAIELEQMTAQ